MRNGNREGASRLPFPFCLLCGPRSVSFSPRFRKFFFSEASSALRIYNMCTYVRASKRGRGSAHAEGGGGWSVDSYKTRRGETVRQMNGWNILRFRRWSLLLCCGERRDSDMVKFSLPPPSVDGALHSALPPLCSQNAKKNLSVLNH